MPLPTVEITSAPRSALITRPRPPKRLVPPITAAGIASSRRVPPPALRATGVRRGGGESPPQAALRAGGEDDPPEAGHQAGDHEDVDADSGDVDAGASRRLGVPPDGVDVAAERRP